MTWEDKLAALQEIDPAMIRMRGRGDWTVGFGNLAQRMPAGAMRNLLGTGATIAKAVDEVWRLATEMPAGWVLVVNPYRSEGQRRLRWDGTGWADVPASPADQK